MLTLVTPINLHTSSNRVERKLGPVDAWYSVTRYFVPQTGEQSSQPSDQLQQTERGSCSTSTPTRWSTHWYRLERGVSLPVSPLSGCTHKAISIKSSYIHSHPLPPISSTQGGIYILLSKVARELAGMVLLQQRNS